MKALLATHDFPPGFGGGIATYYYELCSRLEGRISVLAPSPEGADEFDGAQSFQVHRRRIPQLSTGLMTETRFPLLRLPRLMGLMAAHSLLYATHLRKLLGSGDFATLLLGHAYLAPVGVPFRKGGKIGTGVFLHGSELNRYKNFAPIQRGLIDSLNALDFLIVNSGFTREQYLERGVRDDHTFFVLNPGVDTEAFRPDAGDPAAMRAHLGVGDRPVVLAVARLVECKGQDTLIQALPVILDAVPEAVCVIGGSGPYREGLEALAREAGVHDRVVFAGWVGTSDLPSLYRMADVMALPSRDIVPGLPIEGFGIVYLEANSCGVPVVGGSEGGTGDSIEEGVSGFRVDSESPASVAEATVRLLSDSELRSRMGRAGRERAVESFDWSVQAGRLRDFLDAVGAAP